MFPQSLLEHSPLILAGDSYPRVLTPLMNHIVSCRLILRTSGQSSDATHRQRSPIICKVLIHRFAFKIKETSPYLFRAEVEPRMPVPCLL